MAMPSTKERLTGQAISERLGWTAASMMCRAACGFPRAPVTAAHRDDRYCRTCLRLIEHGKTSQDPKVDLALHIVEYHITEDARHFIFDFQTVVGRWAQERLMERSTLRARPLTEEHAARRGHTLAHELAPSRTADSRAGESYSLDEGLRILNADETKRK